jgi:hypothetical protein
MPVKSKPTAGALLQLPSCQLPFGTSPSGRQDLMASILELWSPTLTLQEGEPDSQALGKQLWQAEQLWKSLVSRVGGSACAVCGRCGCVGEACVRGMGLRVCVIGNLLVEVPTLGVIVKTILDLRPTLGGRSAGWASLS